MSAQSFPKIGALLLQDSTFIQLPSKHTAFHLQIPRPDILHGSYKEIQLGMRILTSDGLKGVGTSPGQELQLDSFGVDGLAAHYANCAN